MANVPTWRRVRYAGLYPGVDLEFYGEGSGWAWRLVMTGARSSRPGTYAARLLGRVLGQEEPTVRLEVEGAEGVSLEGEALRLETEVGPVLVPLPEVAGPVGETYEGAPEARMNGNVVEIPLTSASPEDAGDAQGSQRAGRLALLSPERLRAQTATAGTGGLVFATLVRGSKAEGGYGLDVDPESGGVYLTGRTESTDFPDAPGPFVGGNNDVFLRRMDASGAPIYTVFLGGQGDDHGLDVVLGPGGEAYLVGRTSSEDFPITPSAFQVGLGGLYDVFLAEVDSAGTALNYSTYFGGSS